jgi:putative heme-binding domain-containing protein
VHSTAKKFELNLRGHDLRFNPDDGSMELQPGPTQFGRHRDDWGNWFGNDNSRWLWHYFLPEQYLARNSHLAVNSLMKLLPGDPDPERIFAISRPQQRFNWPTHVFEVTSACSATPYRDEVLGPDFASSVFICEPANNVVHREVLQPEGVSFVSHRGREEQSSEFLASTDNWFRPVMVKTGPDGALYLADMYRLIIEHPEYFPEELKRRSDLRAGEDKGRIYRVYPANAQLRKIPRLDRLSLPELVAAMDSPNGWQRDTVQRLLVEAQNPAVVKDLENLVTHSGNPKVRLQALCTLDGLHAVTAKLLLDALGDAHYAVRRQALALSESKFSIAPELNARLLEMAEDPDLRVRYQLAFSLGEWKGTAAGQALAHIAMKDWSDGAMQTAILSSAPRHLETLVTTVFSTALSRKAESHEAQNNSQSGPRGTRPSERWPADSLVESLVALATEIPENRVLAHALDQLTQPLTQDFAPWQFAGVVGFLDGLDKRKLSLAAFKQQAGAEFQPSLARLEPIFVQARIVALDPKIVDEQRVIALQLLGRGVDGQEQDIASLGGLIEPQNPAAIQHAALAQLRREDNPAVPQALFKSWKTSGPSRKQEILNLLFSRPAWTEAVLTAVEQDKLTAAELGALQRQKLLNYSVPDIQARAAKLLSSISADRQQIVAKFKIVPELAGDRSHGRALFAQNCAICHSLQGEGHHVGPDLGTVADKPVQELVVAILDPNQAVDPAYASYTAVTKDDRELTGVLIADTPNSISLRMAGGSEETILRNNLKELTSSGRSLMPEGFETGLKPQDIADLIAFISDTPPPSRP